MGDPCPCLRHLPPPDEGTLLSELVQHQKHLSQRKQHEMVRITGYPFPLTSHHEPTRCVAVKLLTCMVTGFM